MKEKEDLQFIGQIKEAMDQLTSLREGGKDDKPEDLTLGEYIKEKFNFAPDEDGTPQSFYQAIGIDPSKATIQYLLSLPDDRKWLVPEVIREAVRQGLRNGAMYPGMIAGEDTVAGKDIRVPHMDMSRAYPKEIKEGETFPEGFVSYGDRLVGLKKVGTSLKMSYEVRMYVSINLIAAFLEDTGVLLGNKQDAMMVDVLLNGDQDASSTSDMSAPVVGVENTTNGIQYDDILDVMLTMGMLTRTPQAMLAGKAQLKKVLQLAEFKNLDQSLAPQGGVNLRTPVPQSLDAYVHGAMPSNRLMLINTRSALFRFVSSPLMVEREKIMANQLEAVYVSLVTGFANIKRDAPEMR